MQKGQCIVIRHLVLPILDELVIIHRTFDGEIEESCESGGAIPSANYPSLSILEEALLHTLMGMMF